MRTTDPTATDPKATDPTATDPTATDPTATDLKAKATVYAVVIALAIAGGLVPTAMHSSHASQRGAAVTVVAQSHRLTVGSPDNNPWD